MGVEKSRETIPAVGSKPLLNTVKTPYFVKIAWHTKKFVPEKKIMDDQNDENAQILSLSVSW